MSHDFSTLINNCKKWNIVLTEKQIKQFDQYYDLLVEWNSFMNLTAITEFDEVCQKHFLDSLSIVKAYPDHYFKENTFQFIDIGTGAGFPSIPIKIVFPNLKFTLVDSLNKRIKFLNEVIDQLQLSDCTAVHGRAEDLAKNSSYREQYDFCVSRAVANLSTLCEYCMPYVKVGGRFVSYKSEKITEEAEKAKHAISVLGGKFERQVEFTLPDSDIYRNIYIIQKEKITPKKYPRKAGLPSKEPL
jgi:16S rRNA (guanine527-N7)-methyltransferase